MKLTTISSKENKLYSLISKLINLKQHRDKTRLFVAEGYRVVCTLLESNKPMTIVIDSESKYIDKAKELSAHCEIVLFKHSLFNQLSSVANSDGVLAIFNKKDLPMEISKTKNYLILDRIQNPLNLGSIVRSACAFNINGIIITNDSVDIYHPNIIRSTVGLINKIPFRYSTDLMYEISNLKKNGIKIIGTALNNKTVDVDSINNLTTGIAIIVGNEGNGVNPKILAACDLCVKINTRIESLNVAVATGIILSKLCKLS